MTDENQTSGLRDRLQSSSEEALGRLVQDVLQNPAVTSALGHVFEARERASQAQEAAMGALNLPSAGDLSRLTRRVRSVGQRLEGIEDALDRLDDRLDTPSTGSLEERLAAIESAVSKLAPATKPAAKTTAAKKPAAKKQVAKKSAAKKPAAKKSATSKRSS